MKDTDTVPGVFNWICLIQPFCSSRWWLYFRFILVDRVKKQSEDDSSGLTDNESGSGEYMHVLVEQGD